MVSESTAIPLTRSTIGEVMCNLLRAEEEETNKKAERLGAVVGARRCRLSFWAGQPLFDFNLFLFLLRLFRLGKPYLQNSVFVLGLDLVGLDFSRKGECPVEGSVRAFPAVIV